LGGQVEVPDIGQSEEAPEVVDHVPEETEPEQQVPNNSTESEVTEATGNQTSA